MITFLTIFYHTTIFIVALSPSDIFYIHLFVHFPHLFLPECRLHGSRFGFTISFSVPRTMPGFTELNKYYLIMADQTLKKLWAD